MSSLANISVRFRADLKQFSTEMQNATRTLKKQGKQFQKVGQNMSTYISAPLALVGGMAVKTFADFEQALAQVEAVSGATGEQMQKLKQNAEDLGASTRFAASEVAGLQLNFSKLGLSPDEILNATEATLALAQASGEDLATSATVAASTLKGFGLDATEATRVTDVMADSFSSSALDLSKFQTAMATVAPVAKTAGQSIESTTGMLAVLVNAGIDASTAGTGLRNIFLDIAQSGMSMEEAFQMINESSNKNATSMDLFGKRGATVATVLAENAEQAAEFGKQFENAEGSAKRMAEIMDDTLQGSFMRLKSAMESAFISLGQDLAPIIRQVADFVAGLAARFKELSPTIRKAIVIIGGIVAAVGPLLAGLGFLMTTVIPGLVTAFGALSAPILAVAAAIAGIAFVVVKYWDEIKREVLALANYFIDLYNESIIVRVGVENIVMQFKTLWEVGKLVFEGLKTAIKAWWSFTKNTFKTFGAAFKAIITGNFSDLPDILKDNANKTRDIFATTLADITKDIAGFTAGMASNVQESLDRVAGRKRLEIKTTAKVDKVEMAEDASAAATPTDAGEAGTGRAQISSASTLESQGPTQLASITGDLISDEQMTKMSAFNEQLLVMRDRAQIVGSAVSDAFQGMSERMIAGLDLAETGMQGFVKNIAKTFLKLIQMLLSNAIANAVAGATQSAVGTGPAAVFAQPAFIATAVGGVLSAFAAIPKFADGGIVSGPTMGLMGEYAGATNNPEVIAPLDKLKSMLGDAGGGAQTIRVEGRVKGQDLLFSNARAQNYRDRRG